MVYNKGMKKQYKSKQSSHFQLPKALSENQLSFMNAIVDKDMVIATGPAGSGKTFLTAVYAAYYYHTGKVEKIVLTRPTVPTGKSIGFFPGDLQEKMAPWTAPFISVLESYLSKGGVECMIKNGHLEIVPFEVIRGRTFDKAFVILDEAQNTTFTEMKAFVTRMGEDSKMIVNGDLDQSDLNTVTNGLSVLKTTLELRTNSKLASKVGLINFTWDDIVRSELCKLWVKAFG